METSSDLSRLVETFEFLEDWTDRYRHLIEVARKLEPLEDEHKVPANKVDGCMSQVWLVAEPDPADPSILHFRGDSDAQIVRGLIAVVFMLFSGRKAQDIVATDERQVFQKLGLDAHLSVGRRNGLESMVKRIKLMANRAA